MPAPSTPTFHPLWQQIKALIDRGAVIGAVAFTLLKELYQSEALLGPLAAHWQLTLGLTIIAFVALLPKGLIGLKARLSGGAHA